MNGLRTAGCLRFGWAVYSGRGPAGQAGPSGNQASRPGNPLSRSGTVRLTAQPRLTGSASGQHEILRGGLWRHPSPATRCCENKTRIEALERFGHGPFRRWSSSLRGGAFPAGQAQEFINPEGRTLTICPAPATGDCAKLALLHARAPRGAFRECRKCWRTNAEFSAGSDSGQLRSALNPFANGVVQNGSNFLDLPAPAPQVSEKHY